MAENDVTTTKEFHKGRALRSLLDEQVPDATCGRVRVLEDSEGRYVAFFDQQVPKNIREQIEAAVNMRNMHTEEVADSTIKDDDGLDAHALRGLREAKEEAIVREREQREAKLFRMDSALYDLRSLRARQKVEIKRLKADRKRIKNEYDEMSARFNQHLVEHREWLSDGDYPRQDEDDSDDFPF